MGGFGAYDRSAQLWNALEQRFKQDEAERKVRAKIKNDSTRNLIKGLVGTAAGFGTAALTGGVGIPAIVAALANTAGNVKDVYDTHKEGADLEEAPNSTTSKVLHGVGTVADLGGGLGNIVNLGKNLAGNAEGVSQGAQAIKNVMTPGMAAIKAAPVSTAVELDKIKNLVEPAAEIASVATKAAPTMLDTVNPAVAASGGKEGLLKKLAVKDPNFGGVPAPAAAVVEEAPKGIWGRFKDKALGMGGALEDFIDSAKEKVSNIDKTTLAAKLMPVGAGAINGYIDHLDSKEMGDDSSPLKRIIGGAGSALGEVLKNEAKKLGTTAVAKQKVAGDFDAMIESGDAKTVAEGVKGKLDEKKQDTAAEEKAEKEFQRKLKEERREKIRQEAEKEKNRRHAEKMAMMAKKDQEKKAPKMSTLIPSITVAEEKERTAMAKALGLHKNPDLFQAYLVNPESLEHLKFTPGWNKLVKDKWEVKEGMSYKKDPKTGEIIWVQDGGRR